MKKLFALLTILLAALSCEDNFNPFGELKDEYVLNCIINGDTTFHTATITRSYMIENYDPYSNATDPNVVGAKIRIWSGDSTALFRDTSVARPTPTQYKIPYHVYYTKNFQPFVDKNLEIEAILPSGKKLSASTIPPNPIAFDYCESFIPSKKNSTINFRWNGGVLNQSYITRLSIYYLKVVGNERIFNQFVVPLRYDKVNNVTYAIYPRVSNDNFMMLEMSTISEAMQLISEGDSQKKNYEIIGAFFEVMALDKNLSAYYNATARSMDAYSVKLDEVDYTNVSKGYGIFGMYLKDHWNLYFSHSYVESFGYVPIGPNIDSPL